VHYEDYSAITRENHLLRHAAHRLTTVSRLNQGIRNELRRLDAQLDEVPLSAFPSCSRPTTTRLNSHYALALDLAWIIMNSRGPGIARGETPSTVFAFDMNRVFEEFLGRALQERLQLPGTRLRFRSSDNSSQLVALDSDRFIMLKPDITWLRRGTPIGVVDAKYKHTISNDDVYQALAYAIALKLPASHLVLPSAVPEPWLPTRVSIGSTTIFVHRINLAGQADSMWADLDELAVQIGRLAGS
jgi:5-methylcytosine-specific restriction enzyme subunit McrC